MIEIVKKAIQSVEGIKDFKFYDDFMFNFEKGEVDYPCAVLKPAQEFIFDRDAFIRDKMQITLSILDLIPKDYDGDTLYRADNNCAELLLKVLTNLQTKFDFDREVRVACLEPDIEYIVGAMIQLTISAKQPRCAGQPTYYEVQIESVRKVTITENGKLSIRPSEGYDAIKGVDVSVEIPQLTLEEKQVTITSNGEVEILPTNADVMTKVTANVQVPLPPLEEKQVTITKAKTTEIITPDAEYGLSRVEVLTDIPLESKHITITENGTTTIEASEGFEGIESVEVTTDVNTLQGLDFSRIYDKTQADELNQYYKDGIDYAKRLIEIAPTISSWSYYFSNVDPSSSNKCLFIPIMENYKWVNPTFMFQFTDVEYVPYMKVSSTINFMFYYCGRLKSVTLENVTKGSNYNSVFANCINVEKIHLISSVSDAYAFSNTFYNCYRLKDLQLNGYAKNNISLAHSPKLSAESIRYILEHAYTKAEGATDRILTLHSTAKNNLKASFDSEEQYNNYLGLILDKTGITIA